MINSILPFLWQAVIAGGGGAVVFLLTVKYFGQKLIDTSIQRNIEALRHKHLTEIEELKFSFQRDLDRRTKISQIEFDVIPKIWAMMVDAISKTKMAHIRFREYPDLTTFSDEELENFLDKANIAEVNKKHILGAQPKDRNGIFSKADDYRLA